MSEAREASKLVVARSKLSAARYRYPTRGLSIIAVAGPYGKTTTARYFEQILKEAGRTVSVVCNDNDGTYDTSANAFFKRMAQVRKANSDAVVVEITDNLLRLGVLTEVTIDYLILTGDSSATEALLDLAPKHVVAPSDVSVPNNVVEPHQHISYGNDDAAEAQLYTVTLYKKGTEINLTIDHQTKLDLATHLLGFANAYNAVAAASATYVMAVALEAIQEGIANVERAAGSFERLELEYPFMIIIDQAVHPVSIERAVASCRELAKRRLIVVAGDEAISDETIATLRTLSDRLFITGADRDVPQSVDLVETLDDAIQKAVRGAKQDDIVLLLGKAVASRHGSKTYAETVLEEKA